jgi:hypothetical protein
MLSVILTASVLFPSISAAHMVGILISGSTLALLMTLLVRVIERRRGEPLERAPTPSVSDRVSWRMPPLGQLPPAQLTLLNKTWLIVLRSYLFIAAGLVLARIAQLLAGH